MTVEVVMAAAAVIVTVVGAAFGVVLKQAVSEARLTEKLAGIVATLAEMKAEHMRSATSQGDRIGIVEDDVGTLKDFKARAEERRQHERDMSGVVRNP